MANLFPIPRYHALDGNGDPYAGALLYTYEAGTTTPLAVYTDSTLGTAHANPVVADANGRFAAVWMAASNYKFVLKTAAGVTIWTEDNVSGTFDVTGNDYKPSQQSTPDMTVLVAAGSFWDAPTGAIVSNAAQTSALITAPVTNPRIDTIHMNRRTGVIGVTTGSEAASPTAPTLAAGLLPVANVTLATTTTSIIDSLITDVRELEQLGLGTAAAVDTGVASGNVPLMDATGYPAADGSQITNISVFPRGHIDGLILSNDATDALKDIDISAGEAVDDGQAATMVLSSALIKKLDASWAVGTNQGALDGTESVAGTPDASTWYHIWLIRRSDTGVVDILASESATAPTMPTSYDQKRRIGAVLFDATPDILAFTQVGDEFLWTTPIRDVNSTTLSTTAVLYPLSVPLGIKVVALLNINLTDTAGFVYISSPDASDQAASSTASPIAQLYGELDAGLGGGQFRFRTDTSSQIRARGNSAISNFRVATVGWIDPRGRNA